MHMCYSLRVKIKCETPHMAHRLWVNFVCVCFLGCGRQPPKFSPMADEAFHWWYTRSEIPLYICGDGPICLYKHRAVGVNPTKTMQYLASLDEIFCWASRIRHLFFSFFRVLCVTFDSGHQRLASGSKDTTIKLWDIRSGAIIGTLKGHKVSSMSRYRF